MAVWVTVTLGLPQDLAEAVARDPQAFIKELQAQGFWRIDLTAEDDWRDAFDGTLSSDEFRRLHMGGF